MYQNTPWENLALWAPWLGVAAIVGAIALLVALIARERSHGAFASYYPLSQVAASALALGASLIVLGTLFTILWRPAHDTYPHPFGAAAIKVAIGSAVVALIIGLVKRNWRWEALTFGALTASVAAAAAISAYSHSIIAEGQVTAMVLPVSFVVCALLANIIASVKYQDAVMYEGISVAAFLVLAFIAANKLPVVQFRADSSLYPVTGAFYIVMLGRLARTWAIPTWFSIGAGIAAIGIGYMFAHWYGLAIAAVGLSISGALDLRRLPSEGFRPQRSTIS